MPSYSSMTLEEILAAEQRQVQELEMLVKGREAFDCSQSLHKYMKAAWSVVDSNKFIDNWHLEAICDHLQALFKREIRKLLIMQPPRMAKSLTSVVGFPTWVWANRPEEIIYSAAYQKDLADRDSWRSRLLIQSDWYQKNWGHLYQLQPDSNRRDRYDNTKNGQRVAMSPESGSTGYGYTILIIDDPHKAVDVKSTAKRTAVLEWYSSAMSTRANSPNAGNPLQGVQVVIGQRLHYADLIGELYASGEWECLKLPMEYVPTTYVTSIGWSDPRTKPGELLFPARFNEVAVAELKLSLKTSTNVSAQLQQEPVPPGGGLVKEKYLRTYITEPKKYDTIITSWDLASGEETSSGSYSVGLVIGKLAFDYYVLDMFRGRVEFPRQLDAMRNLSTKYPAARTHLIEGKASGTATRSVLRNEISGLVLIDPRAGINGGSKEERLEACLFQFEAGHVVIPDETLIRAQEWRKAFIEEVTTFPSGSSDDIVDALTQALNWLQSKGRTVAIGGDAMGYDDKSVSNMMLERGARLDNGQNIGQTLYGDSFACTNQAIRELFKD